MKVKYKASLDNVQRINMVTQSTFFMELCLLVNFTMEIVFAELCTNKEHHQMMCRGEEL